MRATPTRQTLQSAHVPAPLGGINNVDAGSAMPASDCIYAWNVIGAEYGLRTRLGYREWVTGCTGALESAIRTMLPFTGSSANGTNDKLFAVTDTGIWDVTASTAAPTQVLTFSVSAGLSGYGTGCVMSTSAGRFLLYCDEVNGLFIYTESTGTWAQVTSGVTQAWSGSTAYVVGNRVTNGGNEYICNTSGTSAASGGPVLTGADEVDGTTRWDYVSAAASSSIGPCLADQNLGYTADPANFVHVSVWKNRVWFVERDTARAYYLDTNAIYGTATSFNFGPKMRAGGPLVGLYNWSYDGGNGIDTLLVGLSTAGDVVIYQGTDPASASTFGLKGCWSVGAVPTGRDIVTDYGGDVLILSLLGAVPLSKLVVGAKTDDQAIYPTRKVSPLINQIASTKASLRGWRILIHPGDNALMICHPDLPGSASQQLCMSLATGGWSRYRDLPIFSACVWNRELYFGTADGRVCRSVDYVDNVQLGESFWVPSTAYVIGNRVVNGGNIYVCDTNGTSASSGGPTGTSTNITDGTARWDYVEPYYAPVDYSVFGSYSNLGTGRQKQVQMIRPTILTGDSTAVWTAEARYRYNLLEPSSPSGSLAGGWDTGLWNTETWGADYTASQSIVGAVGMGRDVAIAIRGKAWTRTVLVGWDVFFQLGGDL